MINVNLNEEFKNAQENKNIGVFCKALLSLSELNIDYMNFYFQANEEDKKQLNKYLNSDYCKYLVKKSFEKIVQNNKENKKLEEIDLNMVFTFNEKINLLQKDLLLNNDFKKKLYNYFSTNKDKENIYQLLDLFYEFIEDKIVKEELIEQIQSVKNQRVKLHEKALNQLILNSIVEHYGEIKLQDLQQFKNEKNQSILLEVILFKIENKDLDNFYNRYSCLNKDLLVKKICKKIGISHFDKKDLYEKTISNKKIVLETFLYRSSCIENSDLLFKITEHFCEDLSVFNPCQKYLGKKYLQKLTEIMTICEKEKISRSLGKDFKSSSLINKI